MVQPCIAGRLHRLACPCVCCQQNGAALYYKLGLAPEQMSCACRAAAAGADVADEVCAGATHIVAERDMPAQQAADRLEGRLEPFADFLQVPLPWKHSKP